MERKEELKEEIKKLKEIKIKIAKVCEELKEIDDKLEADEMLNNIK